MADTLDLIPVPDTSTMRALSQHLKVSADGYNEHLQSLKANQKPLQENWQGDGTSAYVQSNGQLSLIGGVHVEQMQRASSIFESTADLLDEGRCDPGCGRAAVEPGTSTQTDWSVCRGCHLRSSARVMQATALATVSAARTLFNSGFASLTAEINTTPSMTSMIRDTYAGEGDLSKTSRPEACHDPTLNPTCDPPIWGITRRGRGWGRGGVGALVDPVPPSHTLRVPQPHLRHLCIQITRSLPRQQIPSHQL